MVYRPNNIVPYSRDYRRPPRWGMGLPPRRPKRRGPNDPRTWLRLVIAVAGFGLLLLPPGADAITAVLGPRSEGGCRVVKVIDGDTLTLWCSGRGITKARIKGIDTPEVFSPSCASEWAAGIAATWQMRRLLFGTGTLVVGFAGTDRYGRALITVAADGRSLAGRMIASGHARAYDGGQRKGWCA